MENQKTLTDEDIFCAWFVREYGMDSDASNDEILGVIDPYECMPKELIRLVNQARLTGSTEGAKEQLEKDAKIARDTGFYKVEDYPETIAQGIEAGAVMCVRFVDGSYAV